MSAQNNNWTSEPGNYWFHGWLHKCSYGNKPKTYLVKARKLENSTVPTLVTEGSFIYKHNGVKGLWVSADVPEPSEFNL